MNLALDKTTRIGLGHAAHADAFQGGREAAQMAKSQLTDSKLDLVLAFGPGNVRFKDFIEGVRLVTGENNLIGIPVGHAVSTEQTSPDSCFVLILQSTSTQFSIAAQDVQPGQLLSGATSIMSQFRQARGNSIRNFKHRGLLLFKHFFAEQKNSLAYQIASDMGLETWMVGGVPLLEKSNPFVCQNSTIQNGLVGIECLSQQPWGIGSVNTGSFPTQADVYREATKSAMREALAHLAGSAPVFGLIFFDLPSEISSNDAQTILDGAALLVPHVPIIGIPTQRRFVRPLNQPLKMEKESVVALLVPA